MHIRLPHLLLHVFRSRKTAALHISLHNFAPEKNSCKQTRRDKISSLRSRSASTESMLLTCQVSQEAHSHSPIIVSVSLGGSQVLNRMVLPMLGGLDTPEQSEAGQFLILRLLSTGAYPLLDDVHKIVVQAKKDEKNEACNSTFVNLGLEGSHSWNFHHTLLLGPSQGSCCRKWWARPLRRARLKRWFRQGKKRCQSSPRSETVSLSWNMTWLFLYMIVRNIGEV